MAPKRKSTAVDPAPAPPVPTRTSARKKAKVDYTEPSNTVQAGDKTEAAVGGSLPSTSTASGGVRAYRDLLIKQKKELYKDPPTLPPNDVKVLKGSKPIMKRNAKGELTTPDHPDFRPNLTPKEMFQLGSFGGTYFRPIVSAVTGAKYGKEVYQEFPADWFEGLDVPRHVASPLYDEAVNKYGVKCGGSLGMWESSGWISSLDPYGWVHWYCRFYLGRRSTDDQRQIDRWKSGHGPTGRFRVQLLNKIISANAKVDDYSISPVIRQTCQHWAYAVTQADLDAHKKKKK